MRPFVIKMAKSYKFYIDYMYKYNTFYIDFQYKNNILFH